jgi:general secretion pathway protein D
LDIAPKVTAGTVENYVYRVRYGWAEALASAIMQLYLGYGMAGGYGMGGYGGMYAPQVMLAPAQQSHAATSATPMGGTAGTTAGTDLTGSYLGAYGTGYPPASQVPRVIPNPMDNTLLIQATPQDYREILKLLDKLDLPPRQVLLEAKIFEVNMQDGFASGVQAYLQRLEEGSPTGFPASRLVQGAIGSAGLGLTAGLLVGNSRQLLALLNASQDNRRAKLISAPSLIATDSIPAMMNVGDEVPTLTSQAVGNIQSGSNSLFAQTVQSVQSGVTLNVTARITPSGIVTLRIQQEVSTPVAPSADAKIASPSFQKRSFQTQVTVQDGDTIAIGGIISETDRYSTAGVPLLHRIPGIGALFGSKSLNKTRTEMVVFITPRVIYDTNQLVEATEELKSGFRRLRPLLDR